MRLHKLIRAVENKYNRLLAILVLIYLASPILLDWAIGDLIVAVGFLGAIVLAIYQIEQSQKALRFSLALIILALLLHGLSEALFAIPNLSLVLSTAASITFILFLTFSTYLILRELAISEKITADTIKGGICAYFLFGFLWFSLYNLNFHFDANSFGSASKTVVSSGLMHFSFTTLTTVGYGDVFPRSEMARVLANLEGIVGVMYPAIFIARLVGQHSIR